MGEPPNQAGLSDPRIAHKHHFKQKLVIFHYRNLKTKLIIVTHHRANESEINQTVGTFFASINCAIHDETPSKSKGISNGINTQKGGVFTWELNDKLAHLNNKNVLI